MLHSLILVSADICFSSIQGVVSSNIYIDSPQYYVGHGVVLAYLFVFLLCGSLITRFLLVQENKKRKAGERDRWMENKNEADMRLMGDNRYRYNFP